MESSGNQIDNLTSTIGEDIQSLKSIYRQISIEFNDCFDEVEETNLLVSFIDGCFSIEFKQIPTLTLAQDLTLFNTEFVRYIKFCQSHKYLKINMMFITFCDYFDLPYHLMYEKLHLKLQTNIKNRYIKTIGADEYQKQVQRYEEPKDYYQPTLFELLIDEDK